MDSSSASSPRSQVPYGMRPAVMGRFSGTPAWGQDAGSESTGFDAFPRTPEPLKSSATFQEPYGNATGLKDPYAQPVVWGHKPRAATGWPYTRSQDIQPGIGEQAGGASLQRRASALASGLPSSLPGWDLDALSTQEGVKTVNLLTGLPGWLSDQGSKERAGLEEMGQAGSFQNGWGRAGQNQSARNQGGWSLPAKGLPDWDQVRSGSPGTSQLDNDKPGSGQPGWSTAVWDQALSGPADSLQVADSDAPRKPAPNAPQLDLSDSDLPTGKPLSGYEDDYRDTPVNERPFLLFQRNGSSIQHRDMEQAAMELLQEAAANKRAGLGLVGEDRADDGLEQVLDKYRSDADGGDTSTDYGYGQGTTSRDGETPWWLARQGRDGIFDQLADDASRLSTKHDVGANEARAQFIEDELLDPSKDKLFPAKKYNLNDTKDMRDFHFDRYGDAAWKASAKYGVPFHVLLGLAEREKRGGNPKFTSNAGNGPTQIQRDAYLQYLYDTNQVTEEKYKEESRTVENGLAPFKDQELEDKYYNDVNDYDTAFEITAKILKGYMDGKNSKKMSLGQALALYNRGADPEEYSRDVLARSKKYELKR